MNEVIPYATGKFGYQDSTGKRTDYKDMDANSIIYILVNAVKEQQEMPERQ